MSLALVSLKASQSVQIIRKFELDQTLQLLTRSNLRIFLENAILGSQIDVDGAAVLFPVVRSANDQILDSLGVLPRPAVQVDVAGASHAEAEASLVVLAVQSVEFLEFVLHKKKKE